MGAKEKVESLSADDIAMMAIKFCEKHGCLNQYMGLSTIEGIRYSKDKATRYLKRLVSTCGDIEDQKGLEELMKEGRIDA